MRSSPLSLVLAATLASTAQAASHHHGQPAGPLRDLGSLRTATSDEVVEATVALKLRDAATLEPLALALHDRSSPQFHQFLTPEQFNARFAPTPETVQAATRALQAQGLTVTEAATGLLTVRGPASALERAFGVQLHAYAIADTPTPREQHFHAPAGPVTLHPSLVSTVQGVVGLNTRPLLQPMHRAEARQRTPAGHGGDATPNTPHAPGEWTVADFAQYYDVKPLYQRGVDGHGRTIGIVTFAALTPSDVFSYWSSAGLDVRADRLSIINVDGGPGAPSDDAGSDETTLDVEQAGGIAPGAKLVVYQAPNTEQGFVDAFARAIEQNRADVVSVSWGEWEEFLPGTSVTNPTTGATSDELQLLHQLFVRAACQGQSLFAAAGDAGALDAFDSFPSPDFTEVVSVDHPASDPFITAAGGTTLPGPQGYSLPDGSTLTVHIAEERAWGWDYLDGLCSALGVDPISCGTFPVGGGGGVSVLFPVPGYQDGLDGVKKSEPHQTLKDLTTHPATTLLEMPARFAGRNVPDVSANADPNTGYTVYYTSSVDGPGVSTYWGGTSFVAPQLAGVAALLSQDAHSRLGLLNFDLYELAQSGGAYSGHNAPLRDIRSGANEFYKASGGYDPATGIGTLDVANLATVLH